MARKICNWASWIRTSECRSQSPVPYRLAIAHHNTKLVPGTIPGKGWIEGLEPSASRATIWRASQLRHTHHMRLTRASSKHTSVLEGIRTPDPRLRRPLLYPAELWTQTTHSMRKAGDGNRTHVSSLEGWCSTIELHPQKYFAKSLRIGVTGFEPATPWSQTRCSSQAEPHPAGLSLSFTYATQDIL